VLKRFKKMLFKIRNPNVLGETLILTSKEEVWSMYQNLSEEELAEIKTNFERLQGRLQELEQKRAGLVELAGKEVQEAAQALAIGNPAKVSKDMTHQVELMDVAIMLVKEDLQAAEAEHIKTQLAKIEKQRELANKERLAAYAVWQTAETAYQQARQKWNAAAWENDSACRKLDSQAEPLLTRLAEIEPAVDEIPATRTVEAWLDDLRSGKLKNQIMPGMDQNLDAALPIYNNETAVIKEWVRQDKLARKAHGGTVKPPECVKHYTKKRIQELTDSLHYPVRAVDTFARRAAD